MTRSRQNKPALISKVISMPLNFCGRALLTIFDTFADAASLVGNSVKSTCSSVSGSKKGTDSIAEETLADKKTIRKYKAELDSLCTKLGQEIYSADGSHDISANVEIIKNDIETLKRMIAFLEKNQQVPHGKETQKHNSSITPQAISEEQKDIPVKPAEPEKNITEKTDSPTPIVEKKAASKKFAPASQTKKANTIPSKQKLQKMLKSQLLNLAAQLSLDCNPSMTKDKIIEIILKK